ncbi:MAG: hypothetical protein ACD_4C00044G0003, partial [uncultured bacterium (gcode 4)]
MSEVLKFENSESKDKINEFDKLKEPLKSKFKDFYDKLVSEEIKKDFLEWMKNDLDWFNDDIFSRDEIDKFLRNYLIKEETLKTIKIENQEKIEVNQEKNETELKVKTSIESQKDLIQNANERFNKFFNEFWVGSRDDFLNKYPELKKLYDEELKKNQRPEDEQESLKYDLKFFLKKENKEKIQSVTWINEKVFD